MDTITLHHIGVRRESLNQGILMQAMKQADCHDMQPIPEFDSTGNAIDGDYPSSSEALQIYRRLFRNGSTTMKYMDFDDLQKLRQRNVGTAMKLSGEWNKGLQAIAAEMTDYTKRSFEESAATFEKLLSAKSVAQAIEIQTGFAKRAYDGYLHHVSKIGSMYAELAKEPYKPVANALQAAR